MASYLNLITLCFYLFLLLQVIFPTGLSKTNVRYLPGFDGPLPFALETGYVSVGDSELFYYFFESENNPVEDPLLIWFVGGPRCSAASAIFYENGPLSFSTHVFYNGSLPTLVLNPYSWTKVSNIIFLDQPVGTGFSYSRTFSGNYCNDTKSARQSFVFITKWLTDHPDFLANPLYVGGDSYSGKIVPMVATHISDGIEAGETQLLNFQGYLLGNPVTDRYVEVNSQIPFAHGMGLISNELFKSAKKHCGGNYHKVDPSNIECKKDIQAFSECVHPLYPFHVLEPMCLYIAQLELHPECNRDYGHTFSNYWANDYNVQAALNVRKGFQWTACNENFATYFQDVEKSTEFHSHLSKRHYRSLIYSGDHDFVVPYLGTQAWIRSLDYPIQDEWRPWLVNNQVAGYTQTYTNNMTFATVKGGGHTAPEYKPKECFAMFMRWLSHKPL